MLGERIAKYEIKKLIGEGGTASVYLATHIDLEHKVAVKILNPMLTGNKSLRERFKNEARLLASLNHPNITKVIDFEESTSVLAIIMELLAGVDMNEYLQKNGALPLKESIDLFVQILDAFEYAHSKGIVHRDVKPSNIFIEPTGQIKILDFGLAKLFGTGEDATIAGTQMGTPAYMSPEQVNTDRSIDHRSDIYSLGVSLHYMLNGVPPYNSKIHTNFEIFTKIMNDLLPDLTKYPEVDVILKIATAKDRNNRYQSCIEFKEAILQLDLDKLEANYKNQINNVQPKSVKKEVSSPKLEVKKEKSLIKPPQSEKGKAVNTQKIKKLNKTIIIGSAIALLILILVLIKQPWNTKANELANSFKTTDSLVAVNKCNEALLILNELQKINPDQKIIGDKIVQANEQLQKSDEEAYKNAVIINTKNQYEKYINDFPNGNHLEDVKMKMKPKETEQTQQPSKEIATNTDFQKFINRGDQLENQGENYYIEARNQYKLAKETGIDNSVADKKLNRINGLITSSFEEYKKKAKDEYYKKDYANALKHASLANKLKPQDEDCELYIKKSKEKLK